MNREHIQQLLMRMNTAKASDADLKAVESLLEAGVITLDEITDVAALEAQVMELRTPGPSPSLDKRFYEMLATEKARKPFFSWGTLFSWEQLAPKLAMASLMLLLGVATGYWLAPAPKSPDTRIEALSQQVSALQEMMMLSLLEKGSATDRLKAVSLTQEMTEASRKVTDALIRTLNEDENVNVRLAALEALKPYTADSSVREALVRSIAKQESPLVQVSLAELMVALQEKAAVTEFEKLIESGKTPAEVKEKIRESIDILI